MNPIVPNWNIWMNTMKIQKNERKFHEKFKIMEDKNNYLIILALFHSHFKGKPIF
tara:strand:+ start:62943 stop:63107 length:165 start_codon:yes stop_codon:yes gene_type:complete